MTAPPRDTKVSESWSIGKSSHTLIPSSRRGGEILSIDGGIVTLAGEMKEALYRAPGVGLAAPQVGVSRRLILVDPTAGKEPAGSSWS